MTEDEVARYLRGNPGFFQQHPGLFTELLLPDPHDGKAVSLLERQALMLRERVKALENRLAELIRIGRDNDALTRHLVDWTKALLAEPDRGRTLQVAVEELKKVFAVPLAEIRTFGEPPAADEAAAARWVSAMSAPICSSDPELAPLGTLGHQWSHVRSFAVVPLRQAERTQAFGMIALGSSDPARFDAALGTALLSRIGELASAALGPLADPHELAQEDRAPDR